MTKIPVNLTAEHLQQIAKRRGPVLSLAELIWNALDADATQVDVHLEQAVDGTLQWIEVRDDGTGISPADALNGFGRLGDSWKRLNRVTRRDHRALHGKAGEGRFSAFALGFDVEWTSRSEGFQGRVRELTISGSLEGLRSFEISEPVEVEGSTGTLVRVSNIPESVSALCAPGVHEQLVEIFALYLRQYPAVTITFGERSLDPGRLVAGQKRYRIAPMLVDEGEIDDAEVTIVEWNTPMSRNLYLCDAEGFNLQIEKVGVKAPGFEFTAYLRSDYLRQRFEANELLLSDEHHGLKALIGAARDEIRGHFRRRTAERATELVEQWKRDKVYPFEGEPATPVERTEREVFNIVALNVSSYLPEFAGSDTKSKRFSLSLLKQGIESNPANMQLILSQVLDLPKQKQDELAALLKTTTLSSIITASKIVADRLSFIRGLEALLFDRRSKEELLERRGLHRILVDHTWIFGEEFHISVDDQNLNEVLAKHVHLLGREVPSDEGPVRTEDGEVAIVDLMLSRSIKLNRGEEREHLIVELKRPKQKIDAKVLTQVEKYARTVARDERFRDVTTRWTFIAVSNDIGEDAEFRLENDAFPRGTVLVHRPTGITIKAFTWGEIIQNAKARLQFYQEKLNYTADRDDALNQLRATHERYFPPVFRGQDAHEPAIRTDAEGRPKSRRRRSSKGAGADTPTLEFESD